MSAVSLCLGSGSLLTNRVFCLWMLVCTVLSSLLTGIQAHATWIYPEPRYDGTDQLDGYGCGAVTEDFTGNVYAETQPVTELSVGWNTLRWRETVTHIGGPYRIALAVVASGEGAGEESYEEFVLLDDIPHNDNVHAFVEENAGAGRFYEFPVWIPDVDCVTQVCSLQLVGMAIFDEYPNCPITDFPEHRCKAVGHAFFACANVVIAGNTSYASLTPYYTSYSNSTATEPHDWVNIYDTPYHKNLTSNMWTVDGNEYAHTLVMSPEFQFSWTLDPASEVFTGRLTLWDFASYAAIGFGSPVMLGASYLVFSIDDAGVPSLEEYFVENVDKRHQIELYSAAETQGVLVSGTYVLNQTDGGMENSAEFVFERPCNGLLFHDIDLTHTPLLWAHGEFNGNLSFSYHGPEHRGAAMGGEELDLVNYIAYTNTLQFSDAFTFQWSLQDEILSGRFVLTEYASFAAIGFGSKVMLGSEFIVASLSASGDVLVEEYYSQNEEKVHQIKLYDSSHAENVTGTYLFDATNGSQSTAIYTFQRRMTGNQFRGIDLTDTPVVFAFGEFDGNLTFEYHGPQHRGNTVGNIDFTADNVVVDLCEQDTCHGQGECDSTTGTCTCDEGFALPFCEFPSDAGKNELIFDGSMTFTWTVDAERGVLAGTFTLQAPLLGSWAGLEIRENSGTSMASADYIVVHSDDDGNELMVQELYSNPADALSKPLAFADQTNSILSYSVTVDVDTDITTVVWERALVNADEPLFIDLVEGKAVYLLWAHAHDDNTPELKYHKDAHALQAVLVDLYSGSSSPVAGEALERGMIVVFFGLTVFLLLFMLFKPEKWFATPEALGITRPCGIPTRLLAVAVILILVAMAITAVQMTALDGTVGQTDSIMFYCFVFLFLAIMCGNLARPLTVLHVLKTRHVTIPLIPWYSYISFTLGELILVGVYVVLLVSTFVYFHHVIDADLYYVASWARLFGHLTEVNMALSIFPVSRNSIFVYLFGIPFERAIKYHRCLGVQVLLYSTAHLISWYTVFIENDVLWDRITSGPFSEDAFMFTGQIAWFSMVLMGVFAVPYFRRQHFDIFYWSHHLFIVAFIFGVLHSNMVTRGRLLRYAAMSLCLYIFDRMVRFWRGLRAQTAVSVSIELDGITRIECAKQFTYSPGQYCFIAVPAIDRLDWHPFSISSHPVEDTVTFHIKSNGVDTFTGEVAEHVKDMMGREETIQLHVDGPYGSPGLDLESYPVIVLVAGGIGITPVASILGHLLRLAQEASLGITTQKHCLKHVYLVWTVRQATSLTWFTRLIQECLDYNDTYLPTRGPRDVEFHILLHVTRKNRRKTETQTRELTSDSHNRSSDMSASLLQHDELKQTASSSTFHQSQSSTRFFQDETTSALDFLPDHKFGRPDMASVFNQVVDVAAELAAQKAVHMSPSRRSQAPSMESVLVFSCGPEAMLDAIDDEIGTAWNPLIPFTHHKETFKF